jgi:hypothetical protein
MMARWRVDYQGKKLQHLGTIEADTDSEAVEEAAKGSTSSRQGGSRSSWRRSRLRRRPEQKAPPRPKPGLKVSQKWDLPEIVPSCRSGRGRAKWSPLPVFSQIAFAHGQVGRNASLATNAVFEFTVPLGKQSGHNVPDWEHIPRRSVADPLPDFELVKSHCPRCHTEAPNAKPGARPGSVRQGSREGPNVVGQQHPQGAQSQPPCVATA